MNNLLKTLIDAGKELQDLVTKVNKLEEELKDTNEELQIFKDACVDEKGQKIRCCYTCSYWDRRDSTGAYNKYCWDRENVHMGVNAPCNKWVKK